MEIVQIPVLRDNYVYLLHDENSGATAAIDPAEASPVLDVLKARNWTLTHVINTHFHGDHVGGNAILKQQTDCRVYGAFSALEPIPGLDMAIGEGDTIRLGSCEAVVWAAPGHTQQHLVVLFPAEKALFCGDTLFGMGCGRLLGGTAEQLWSTLDRLRSLPGDTRVYCAHEYTLNNGRFALSVEPDNAVLQRRMHDVASARQAGLSTVPFTMRDERDTNPFLRPESPEIRACLEIGENTPDLEVFRELRRRKDFF